MTRAAFAIAAFFTLGMAGPAWAQSSVVLITEPEANLPALPTESLTTRAGVTRGPKVLPSVKVTYLKNPTVDLTKRLTASTQADGIDVAAAEIPPGVHHIRVNVKDSEGRAGAASFALKVAR
jgi:hypothetical protein